MQPVGSTDDLPQIPEPDGSYVLNQIFIIPIYIKKRGNLYLLLVPRFEALALPITAERATQKPTPICIMTLEYIFD